MYGDGELGNMKIYDRNLTGTAASDTSRAAEANKTDPHRQAGASARVTGDRVEFSGSVGALSRAVSADHSARTGRIQALARQVEQGTYHPDAGAISRGLVSEALAAR